MGGATFSWQKGGETQPQRVCLLIAEKISTKQSILSKDKEMRMGKSGSYSRKTMQTNKQNFPSTYS